MTHSTPPCHIASIHLCSQSDIDVNLRHISHAIADAKAMGANIVVLPENACLMGSQALIAPRFDELSAHFATLACTHQIHLIAGTLPCPYRPDGSIVANGKFRQTSLAFAPDGTTVARYDKIHLFRATVADGVGTYDEGATFEAGNRLVVAPCDINGSLISVGMMVCFDLRFARLAQMLHQMGADILVAPSAFTYLTGQAHWQILLQARALDSQCLVVGAAQGGWHQYDTHQRQTWGHSSVVRADGQILATTGTTEVGQSGYLIASALFDANIQQQLRQALPIFDCQRL